MATQIFQTRRGRVTLTGEKLLCEQTGDQPRLVEIARADILECHLVPHVHWFATAWTEVIVRHRDGSLSIPCEADGSATALKAALGF
jgi:hypothetical protein